MREGPARNLDIRTCFRFSLLILDIPFQTYGRMTDSLIGIGSERLLEDAQLDNLLEKSPKTSTWLWLDLPQGRVGVSISRCGGRA